LHGLRKYLDSN